MTDTDVVLEVRDLAKSYPVRRGIVLKREVGTVKAVDGVSLTLHRGKTLGLVGESGSGKSTLAKLLVGVEKPTRGQILVDGVDVSDLGRAARRRLRGTIQMVFQDPYTSLNPRMSVGEIVGEAFAIHPEATPDGGRDKAVRELLDRVGLNPDHVHRYPHQFSGGQRQRIGIARALAVRPRILICDEPVSALDVSIQGQVINLLEELQDDLGLSYLFIAHDLSVVRHIADEVAVMYLGRMVETGRDAEVYEHTGHPYTRALMSAVPVPDPTLRDRREIVLEGDMPSPSDPPSGCHFHTRCWLAPTLADPASDEVRADGAHIPSVCRHDSPKLAPQESPDHLAACHFALDTARR
ncbi:MULTISPECIES: ABC transporter ATP-binding protein [Mumia]|uniref:ABC transporter ATP-binding protein n=1 Tax=Mumia TaxID=1546255 RepID=UPI001423D0C5|nr:MULTISPECIES: oligopeptide/dipeptide ABC transporter ATP-binding protein [unclassified Mumia]QMW67154.1 ATP-binding cassette domain-containing protein [Mumia sp. ZJ1417]